MYSLEGSRVTYAVTFEIDNPPDARFGGSMFHMGEERFQTELLMVNVSTP